MPGKEYTFGRLIAAQSAGDASVLADHGRPVLRLHLTDLTAGRRGGAGGPAVSPVDRVAGSTVVNPLRDPQDRRLPRIAGPCGMVIFGVTGDLSRKKVMPAIYDLASRGLLPPGFSLVGYARRDWADQDFAQVVHDSVKQYARTEFREEVWQQLAEGFRFVQGDFADDVAFDNLRQTILDLDRVRGTGGNHAFYLSIPPRFFPDVIGQLKEHGLADAGPGLVATGRRGEAVRLRPGDRAAAQRDHLRGVPAGVGVPDRPLPRQGDRPEHPGDAVRERDVRADLELQLRRPRADHDGRGHRHRRPGRLLRRHRRGPRRDPEPPAPADGADRDGGAHLLRRAQPAAGEAEGAVVRRTPPAAGPRDRPRAVHRGLGRRPEGARLHPGAGHPEGLHDRDLRGHQARDRDPPVGRGAVLPAARQAAGPPGHRGGRGVQAARRTCRSPRPRPRSSPRTRWSSGSSPTRASPCGSAPRSRAAPWRSAT